MRWMVLLSIIVQFFLSGISLQQPAIIENVNVNYEFEQQLRIKATLNLTKKVQKAQLNLQSQNGQTQQQEITQPIISDFSIVVDLNKTKLEPFARIYYWFVFLFDDGSSFTSPSYWFDYIDNRFQWNSNSSKWFTIFWSGQEEGFGAKLQLIALNGLKSATSILPISPDLPVTIYVYSDSTSIQEVIGEFTSNDVSGGAQLNNNVILVSTSDDLSSTNNLERQIPHELAHILEYKLSKENYSYVPAWLLEGLATSAENYKDPDQARALKLAYKHNSLIPITQLCNSFPLGSEQTTLSYAESASFTQYLISKYGTEKVISIISTSGNGLGCEQLIKNALGEDLNSLSQSWQQESLAQSQVSNQWLSQWPLFLLISIILIPLLIIRHHHQHKLNGEQND